MTPEDAALYTQIGAHIAETFKKLYAMGYDPDDVWSVTFGFAVGAMLGAGIPIRELRTSLEHIAAQTAESERQRQAGAS